MRMLLMTAATLLANVAYFLSDAIYSPNKDVDTRVGLKPGLDNPEVGRTWSTGAGMPQWNAGDREVTGVLWRVRVGWVCARCASGNLRRDVRAARRADLVRHACRGDRCPYCTPGLPRAFKVGVCND